MSDERYTPAQVNPNGADQTSPYGPGSQGSVPPPPPPPSGDGSGGYTAPPPSASGSSPQTGVDLSSREQFINLGLSDVKKMVEGADPGHVRTVGQNWKELHDDLVGAEGDGGLKKKFDDAVKKVLETWHGKSAEKFAKKAQEISQDFADVSYRPAAVGNLLEQVADRLDEVMGMVSAVNEPSNWERAKDRAGDFISTPEGLVSAASPAFAVTNTLLGGNPGRDDSGLNSDLANPNITIAQAVNNNAGKLSIDRERQLEAAHYVEQLAGVYSSARDEIDRVGDPEYKGPKPPSGPGGGPGGGGGVPNISPFDTGKGPGAGPGADMPTADVPGYESTTPVTSPASTDLNGIGGPKPGSQVGTGLDGIGTGAGGAGAGGGGIGGLSGGAGGGLGAGGGTGSGAGGVGSVGMPGGMAGAGGGAAGRGAGRMGGMPGAGGAGAGAGAGKGGAGRGSLARKAGGTVGTPGRGGTAAQGGSGLHKSRGGSQAGKGVGRGMGMMGAPGARGAGGNDKNQSQRPDYLVEDEESWTPQRNVAPRVIE